jgi:hypothetical protein
MTPYWTLASGASAKSTGQTSTGTKKSDMFERNRTARGILAKVFRAPLVTNSFEDFLPVRHVISGFILLDYEYYGLNIKIIVLHQ